MSYPVLQDDAIQKIRRLERDNLSMHYFTEADMGTNIIYNYHITTGAVNSDAIANATITAGDISNATITATQIANATITATQIANATILGTNIATGTITGTNIQNASITGDDIGSGVITGTNIGTASITSDHIQNATIQGGDIATGTITATNITNGTITATQIANATITGTQIASATITGGNIGSGTITGTNIQDASITGSDIGSATVTGSNIGSTTITAGNIANNTITASQIAANTITASQITDLTITSAEIADLTITGAKIAAATLTADKITVTSLSALSANLGTITAGTITGATFQTSASNPRVVMDSAGIRAIDSTATVTFSADASTGKITTLAGVGGANLVRNSTFEALLFDWTTTQPVWDATTPSSFAPIHGTKVARLTSDIPPWTGFNNISQVFGPFDENQPYVFSMFSRSETVSRTTAINVQWLDAAEAHVAWGGFYTGTSLVDTWKRLIGKEVAPTGAKKVRVQFGFDMNSAGDGELHYLDGLQVEKGTIETGFGPKPDEVLPDTITNVEIAPITITNGEIALNTITASQIAANTITSSQIAANTIAATNIAAGAIGTNQLAANAVTATKIAVGGISDNLIMNWSAEGGSTDGWAVVEGSGTITATLSSSAAHGDYYFDTPAPSAIVGYGYRAIPVKPGQKYAFRIYHARNNTGTINASLRVNERADYPATGDHVTSANRASQTLIIDSLGSTFPTLGYYEGVYTAPAGIFWVSPVLYRSGSSTAASLFDAVEMREQAGAVLIEDGAITAKIIQGDTIQTAISGSRVMMTNDGLRAFDDTTESFRISSADGSVAQRGYITVPLSGTTVFSDADTHTFEADIGNWTSTPANITIARSTAQFKEGTASGLVTQAAAGTFDTVKAASSGSYTFVTGRTYLFTMHVYNADADLTTLTFRVGHTASGDNTSKTFTKNKPQENMDELPINVWAPIRIYWTPIADRTTGVEVVFTATSSAATTFYIDALKIQDVTPPASAQLSIRSSVPSGSMIGSIAGIRWDSNSLTQLRSIAETTNDISELRSEVINNSGIPLVGLVARYDPLKTSRKSSLVMVTRADIGGVPEEHVLWDNNRNSVFRTAKSEGFEATFGSGSVAGTGANTWQWVRMATKTTESSLWFNTTDGRYTPQLAGWYILTLSLHADAAMSFNDDVMWQAGVLKNGTIHFAFTGVTQAKVATPRAGGSCVVWANGTTDYFLPAFFHNDSIGHTVHTTTSNTRFSGAYLGT
jgi:uncharacterized protein YjbI with pentapeptide repeats